MTIINGVEMDDGVDEPNVDPPESPLGPEGCCLPGECCMPGPHYESECHTPDMIATPDPVKALEAKLAALEKLVIELTLIAISTAHIQHHHKARLDHLLGELQYAGIESPNAKAT